MKPSKVKQEVNDKIPENDNSKDPHFFHSILIKDVIESFDRQSQNDSPYNRRVIIRNVAAYIEGAIHFLQILHLPLINTQKMNLSAHEEMMLKQETIELLENGKIGIKHFRLQTLPKIKFVLNMCSKLGFDDIDLSGAEWNSFVKTYKVRDRITHPKGIKDLAITDKEIIDAERAFFWLCDIDLAAAQKMEEIVRSAHELMKYAEAKLDAEEQAKLNPIEDKNEISEA